MAYFLGYKNNNEYVPINLDTNDIDKIIKYTNKFYTEKFICYDLIEKGLIDSNKELVYLISKGSKDKNGIYPEYKVLPYTKIYCYSDKDKFNIDYITKYIYKNIYKEDFYNAIYAYYIKNVVGKTAINNFIYNESYNINHSKNMLNSFYIANISDTLKDYLKKFSKIYNENKEKKVFLHSDEYLLYVNNMIKLIYSNNKDLVAIFESIKSYIKKSKIPVIKNLSDLYTNKSDENIQTLINSIIYVYDSKTHEFIRDDFGLKENKRNICDLGSFLVDYDDYVRSIEDYGYDRFEKEEFLTEDDYRLQKKYSKRS